MGLRATTNADEVIGKLDAFMATVVNTAVPRALNKLRDQARTAGIRELSRIYGIPVRKVDDPKFLSTSDASPSNFAASITVKGAGFPLMLFDPRQTRAGVSVTIKGRRITIPHAFIGVMKSGHVGVFARGSYGGKYFKRRSNKGRFVSTGASFGRFQFGNQRLPINELFTFSPPDAFSNEQVTDVMNKRVEEQAEKVFTSEVSFASR